MWAKIRLEVYIQFAASQPITLSKYWKLLGKAWVGAQWLLFRRGPGASNQFESGAFIRSRAGVKYPDIQYHFLPIAVRYDGHAVAEGHGFQAHVGPMRSPSRGEVKLTSVDPDTQPGAEVESDDALNAFIRDHAESAYHPCGCRMGAREDRDAVVDPACRVIGVERLRIADSSIFPRITNGNLNGPSILVGEKAADHILGRGLLAREEPEPWISARWQTSQR